jgi:hypothetical protein
MAIFTFYYGEVAGLPQCTQFIRFLMIWQKVGAELTRNPEWNVL